MIVVILIAGVCSTTYTKRYVKEREISASTRNMTEAAYEILPEAAETAADAAKAAEEAGAGAAKAAAPSAVNAVPAKARDQKEVATGEQEAADRETVVSGQIEDGEQAAAAAANGEVLNDAVPASLDSGEALPAGAGDGAAPLMAAPGASAPLGNPAEGAAGAASAPGALLQETGAEAGAAIQETKAVDRTDVVVAGTGKDKVEISYRTRLEELDAQIERNRKADAEKAVANSVKARAENELKLWEAEVDSILKALEERLDSAQVETLYAGQREWRREAEAKALEAGKRQSGSTLEEVEYSVSMAESTRARAYELVKEYEAVLGE